MTIKKRLAASNLIMILVPIGITLTIAAACVLLIWFTIARGTGLGFEDSENFYQASSGISVLATEALERLSPGDRLEALEMLSSFLDRGAMSLVVTADGEGFYQYGEDTSFMENPTLTAAAKALDYDGTLTKGNHNLHVRTFSSQGTDYIIYIFNTQKQLSYGSIKVAAIVSGGILILTILCSVAFTDRFLIRFVFRRIEQPLDLLSDGVRQISQGNLNFRLDYDRQDEFLPVCQNFNFMAQRLSESVERSRREEESRKELMAGLSHDLRSPLTSIHAYVEGLLDGIAPSPEAQRTYLMTIRRKAEELETMVARILAYSRMDMEQVSRNVVSLKLDEFLKTELDAVFADYSGRGLEISHDLAPFRVNADPEELRQLLANIADNSLKYKTAKQGLLRITLEDRGQTCLLCFADNGPGVPEEALPKLFDLFFRADPARSDRAKGSGLGLAIVEKTVRRMGGRVWAKNAAGSGLLIAMELPKGDCNHAENSDL